MATHLSPLRCRTAPVRDALCPGSGPRSPWPVPPGAPAARTGDPRTALPSRMPHLANRDCIGGVVVKNIAILGLATAGPGFATARLFNAGSPGGDHGSETDERMASCRAADVACRACRACSARDGW